jgi:hypothetical protein
MNLRPCPDIAYLFFYKGRMGKQTERMMRRKEKGKGRPEKERVKKEEEREDEELEGR